MRGDRQGRSRPIHAPVGGAQLTHKEASQRAGKRSAGAAVARVTRAARRPTAPRTGKVPPETVAMRLYQEAKKLGAWDPRLIDLHQDARDWAGLSVAERDVLLRLTALFQVGEEGMTRDLLPLLMMVVRENRPDEELFLTTFLADEAKHTEFFRRILDEVCGHAGDLHRYLTPSYQKLFLEKLPTAMRALLADASPAAQAGALVTYTLISEGVLGEAGYHVFSAALERGGLMPGLREGLRLAQADEDRHIAYGLFRLSRLIAEDAAVWGVIGQRMNELLPDTLGIVSEFFEPYDKMPFGLSLEDTIEYAMTRFAGRWSSLDEARAKAGAATGVSVADEALRQVLAWLRDRTRGAPLVEVGREGTGGIYTFRLGPSGTPVLLISREVLDHHPAQEIIGALTAHGALERLQERTGLPFTCIKAGARILVQAPSGPSGP
jgi:ribonucleoside-diphosphate reductase beta chain